MLKRSFLILVCIGLTTLSSLAQNKTVIRYFKVTEFVYDEKIQNYRETDVYAASGNIVMGSKEIVIDNHKDDSKSRYRISFYEKEEDTLRDMYFCERKEGRCAIALSPDLKYLTMIGVDDRLIYELNKE